jgi:hypothetical protein
MSMFFRGVALCVVLAAAARAQQPDSTRRRTTADSLKAVQDSIALMRELERGQTPATPTQQPVAGAQGPTNPRMLPDVSAVGDLVGDFSPQGSTQEGGTRFGVREVELAIQAPVDPYFRGDIFLGISDLEKIAIEQAYLTATALPWQVEGRLGRFLMPVGKQNTTHRHDLHTVEYPYVIQRFFGDEGLKGTGLYASKVFAPFGFYEELQITAVDRLRDAPEDLVTDVAVNRKLDGLAYSARLRNYWDLNEATNLEVSASGITGRIEQPFDQLNPSNPVNAIPVRQSVVGADFTFRWRPLQQGLYKSFILQGEVMRQLNGAGEISGYLGPQRDFTGAYLFGRYQLTQRLFLGARYDWLQDPDLTGPSTFIRTFTAGSGYLEWFPSEFSKLVAAYEHTSPQGLVAVNRILLQASFSVGPHKPHPF